MAHKLRSVMMSSGFAFTIPGWVIGIRMRDGDTITSPKRKDSANVGCEMGVTAQHRFAVSVPELPCSGCFGDANLADPATASLWAIRSAIHTP